MLVRLATNGNTVFTTKRIGSPDWRPVELRSDVRDGGVGERIVGVLLARVRDVVRVGAPDGDGRGRDVRKDAVADGVVLAATLEGHAARPEPGKGAALKPRSADADHQDVRLG